jgi:hypothetical protein
MHDAAGHVIADALTDRAGAGLNVLVLYDAFGSQSTPTAFFKGIGRGRRPGSQCGFPGRNKKK